MQTGTTQTVAAPSWPMNPDHGGERPILQEWDKDGLRHDPRPCRHSLPRSKGNNRAEYEQHKRTTRGPREDHARTTRGQCASTSLCGGLHHACTRLRPRAPPGQPSPHPPRLNRRLHRSVGVPQAAPASSATAARTLDAAYGEADAWGVKLVLIWLSNRRNVSPGISNSIESSICESMVR